MQEIESTTIKPKVKLSDIQEKFPLSLILRKTLVVNISDMRMINNEERNGVSSKSRQTARKSTNSKLRQISTNILDTFSGDASDGVSSSSENQSKSNMESVSADSAKSKSSAFQKFVNASKEDNTSVLSSTILTDNKIKIISKKSVEKNMDSTSTLSAAGNDHKNSRDAMEVLPVKAKRKFSSDGDKDSSFKSTETMQSTSRKTEKQPIKLLLSTVNGVATVQHSNKPASNFTTVDIQNKSFIKNPSSEVPSPNERFAGHDNPEVSSLKNVQNGSMDVVKSANNKKQKSSIESVLNLNSNKVSTTKEENKLESTPNLKRQSNDNSGSETVCKKPKSSITETVSKCSTNDTSAKDATNTGGKNKTVKAENCEDKLKATVSKLSNIKDIQPSMEKFVEEVVRREVDLRIQLEQKNNQYEKLKEKYESVERNFQSWIEFANKLQARIKKVALALHKQQTNVKMIQTKKPATATKHSVFCQTDLIQRPNLVATDTKPLPAQPAELKAIMTAPSNNILQNAPKQMKSSPSKNVANPEPSSKPRGDVIDLTNEIEAAALHKEAKRLAAAVSHQSPVNHRMLVRHSQKPQAISKVVPGPSNNRISQNHAFHRVQGPVQTSYPSNAPPGCDGTPIKYVPIVPKNALGSNAVCYGDQSMMYQNQAIASTHTVHSNNTACRTNPGQIVGRPPQNQMQIQKKVITPVKNLPYPPLPLAPPTRCRVPPKALGPPPKLLLAIKQNNGGIVLSWSNLYANSVSAEVKGYELYAFQENSKSERKEWRKIGEDSITAMDLPMACTLTQFSSSFVYYFTVRGKDIFGRFGPFSEPCTSKDLFT